MHIAFVCSEYPYCPQKPTGGFGTYVKHISHALVQEGHYVTIIALQDDKFPSVQKEKGIDVILIPSLFFFDSFIPYFNRIVSFLKYPLWFSFKAEQELRRLMKSKKIDIIEGGDFGAELFFYLLLKKKRSVRTVIKLHTPSFIIQKANNENNTLFYKVMYFLEKFCIKRVNCIHSPSKSLANIIQSTLKVNIDTIIPYPYYVAHNNNVTRSKNIILFVGKLQRKKGIFTLIDSIPMVLKVFPRTKFIFIGPDTYSAGTSTRNKIERLLYEKKISHAVTLMHVLPQKEIYKHYSEAIITVIPSLWENYPNVAFEAMDCGSLVIASKTGGILEIIQHKKNGLLCKPDDSEELSKLIIKGLQDNVLRRKITIQAKKYIQLKLDPKKICKDTINFYNKCLNTQCI